MWNTVKISLLTIVAMLVLAVTGLVGYAINDGGGGTATVTPGDVNGDGEFDILDEIGDILEEDFVNPDAITDDVLQRGAINGIITALGDPHTVYISPEDYANGIDIISGSFEGIGANVDQDPATGSISIITPFRDSPAEEAGILPGDIILAVDGESTQGWSVSDAVNRIRGPQGTDVTLTVVHTDGDQEDITITRGTIVVPTVFSHEVIGPDGNVVEDLAYIEIQQFTDETVQSLRAELQNVVDEGYDGLILDLRRNPGGGLDATVNVADMFLDGGIILTQVDRDGSQHVYEATAGGVATDIPMVVLVSSGSASGSEVLAGALQDHGRAEIIGEQTFGKGSVNHLRELSNGGALYVTIARWLTPNGTLIEGVGLTPDVSIETTPEELQTGEGPQIYAAIDILHGQQAASAP